MAKKITKSDGTEFWVPPMFNAKKRPVWVKAVCLDEEIQIETLEGVMTGSKGDYLIQGVNGEFYPCKPDIFHKTYGQMTWDDKEVEADNADAC